MFLKGKPIIANNPWPFDTCMASQIVHVPEFELAESLECLAPRTERWSLMSTVKHETVIFKNK